MTITRPWLLWSGLTLVISGYLAYSLVADDRDRRVFVPGDMSHGHYQIEMACETCHTRSFAAGDALQEACVRCHGKQLKQAKDSHPKSKFTDPRNADTLKQLDARYCVTCHAEHNIEIIGQMGVTLPDDYCFKCHQDIALDRPSHDGLDFTTCASGGCHNFHDNRALYEDFLGKHLHESDLLTNSRVARRNLGEFMRLTGKHPITPLSLADKDAPAELQYDAKISDDWLNTRHAAAGVNCGDCHIDRADSARRQNKSTIWRDEVDHQVCMQCHEQEGEDFLLSRHGMRLAEGLSPMKAGMARQPMRQDAANKQLSCVSCHGAHRFDTQQAAVDSCLGCHADTHSRAYKDSPHFTLWHEEANGLTAEVANKSSGVSCATCHLPREVHHQDGLKRVTVQHNQNANLRPNERMLRDVCMNCHGLGFSIDALADTELVKRNFQGRPATHVKSLDWTEQRLHEANPQPATPVDN